MPPYWIIDAHQDMAYNALSFGRDYLRSAAETRRLEHNTPIVDRNGHTMLGWPEFQRGQVALICATLFIAPQGSGSGSWETQVYRDARQAETLWQGQLDYYRRLAGDHPDHFRLVTNRAELADTLAPWMAQPAELPPPAPEEQEPARRVTHPVGLILLMEGAGGLKEPKQIERWWEAGVRIVGPVWSGSRFCGSNMEPGGFTRQGLELLEVMAGLGMTLDVSHMSEKAVLQAVDAYEGSIVATHANARALLKRPEDERHLSDLCIRRLIEREAVIGILPFGKFLRPGWTSQDAAALTTFDHIVAHIDHICQIAGDAHHVGLGSDFDGGWGWPHATVELNSIADFQKLAPRLAASGYNESEIGLILGENWRAALERNLPPA